MQHATTRHANRLWAIGLVGTLGACTPATEDNGQVSLALTSTASSGTTYRLTASFDVTGPGTFSRRIRTDSTSDVLRLDVAPGSYDLALRDGWSVASVAMDGTLTTVPRVVLLQDPTVSVEVAAGVVSVAAYRFGIGPEFIAFGEGRIDVTPEFVEDAGASCTPAATECADAGAACGAITDSCGGSTDCGTCPSSEVCVANACTLPVSFCVLSFPTSATQSASGTSTVFGRVFVPGLTDVNAAGNDPDPRLIAELGYGPDGSDPAGASWNWTAASPNSAYLGSVPSQDEYTALLTAVPAGTYDYAYRFSGDSGTTWLYCDGGAGSTDGYDVAAAGDLTVTP